MTKKKIFGSNDQKIITLLEIMRTSITLLVIALSLHSVEALAKGQVIGLIKVTKGDSFVIRDGKRINGQIGGSVFQEDVLETEGNGSLGVTLKDNTRLSLGPNSKLKLKEFTFRPRQNKYSFKSEMTRGTLVYLSGMMARLSPESVSVKTPAAIIGIKETHFLIRIGDEGKVEIH